MLWRFVTVVGLLLTPATAATAQFQFEVLHGFSDNGVGGRTPSGPLLETADGSLHGTTPLGGAGDVGVIFRLLPDGSIVTRNVAEVMTGQRPLGGLIQTADGTLYGTTIAGGANDSGTLFAITPAGTFVTYDLPRVTAGPGGSTVFSSGPTTGLVLAADGNLYATVPGRTCCSGSSVYSGGIVRLTPQGVVTKVSAPGAIMSPHGPLAPGPGGYLYGVADPFLWPSFPSNGFRFLPSSGEPEVIHTFNDVSAHTGLVLGPDGNLYGAGGENGLSVFRMTPAGSVEVLHLSQDSSEGIEPVAPLVVGGDENVYGVTSRGGAFNAGTIFRISLAGGFEVIHTFTGGADGGRPLASLIQGSDGSLYGTASTGGPNGGGVVYRITSTFSQPALSIDLPGPGAAVGGSFEIGGWALDRGAFVGSGIDAVHVYAYPNPGSGAAPIFLGAAPLGFARPDVAAVYGARFGNSGWLLRIDSLPAGPYLLAAFAHSTVTDAFDVVVTRAVTVQIESHPRMSIDSPVSDAVVASGSRVFVGGWAIDQGAPSGPGIDAVHVWIYPDAGAGTPFFAGAATFGVSRPDVGAAFGSRFTPSGYQLDVNGLSPGTYVVAVFAHSTVTNSFVVMQTRAVTISP